MNKTFFLSSLAQLPRPISRKSLCHFCFFTLWCWLPERQRRDANIRMLANDTNEVTAGEANSFHSHALVDWCRVVPVQGTNSLILFLERNEKNRPWGRVRLTLSSPLYWYEACFGSRASMPSPKARCIKAGESAKIHPVLSVGGYVFILFWSLPCGGCFVNG